MLQQAYQGPKTLRADQHRMLGEIQDSLRIEPSVLCAAPTGSGKTVVLSEIANRAMTRHARIMTLVHREELLHQLFAALYNQTASLPGVVWKNSNDWSQPATILAQSTLARRDLPEDFEPPDILFIDEAHHARAPTWMHSIQRLRPRFIIAFSATPFRQDKEPLSPEPFARVIRPITPNELIQSGVLCPAIIESLVAYGSDSQLKPVSQASNLPALYRDAVLYATAQGRTKIILYVSKTPDHTPTEIMRQTVALLEQNGITAAAVDQHQNSRERGKAIRRFATAPSTSVLVNYVTLTEGTDIPLIDAVIIGRHTDSESTIIQMIGRGLRAHEAKQDCLVLDYTGRPDMESIIHYWRLDGEKEKGASGAKQPTRLNKQQMDNLSVRFQQQISPLGAAQVDFPWFRPWPGKPLLALELGHRQRPGTYVTAEPQKNGTWRVSHITLNARGPSPVSKRQSGGLDPQEAVRAVQSIIAGQAPHLRRNAPWRSREATPAQREAAARLVNAQADDAATAGELSDLIARERFRRRVPIATL